MRNLKGPHFLRGLEGPGALAIRPDKDCGRHFLATFGSRRAQRYNFQDLSVSANYFAPTYLSLSTPLAFDAASQSYVCVVNSSRLLSWDGVETRLEKVSTGVDLANEALDIVILDSDAYVVFENGAIQTVSYLLCADNQDLGLPPAKEEEELRLKKAWLFHHNGLLYTAKQMLNDTITVSRVTIDPDTQQRLQIGVHRHVLRDPVEHGSVEVAGSQLVQATDGGLLMSPLVGDEKERKIPLQVALCKVNVAVLDQSHVCLLGQDRHEDGSLLLVVDVVYGLSVASAKAKAVANNNDDKGGYCSSVVCHGCKRVMFKHGDRVASVLADDLPSQLAGLVGYKNGCVEDQESCAELEDWQPVGEVSLTLNLYRKLPKLLANCDVAAVEQLLLTHQDLPELLTLNIVEMLVQAPPEKFKLAKRQEAELLVLAFGMPITETLMIQHLRQCDYSVATLILHQLNVLLRDSESDADRLLVWLGLVLDAHYCNFIVSKDDQSRDLLLESLNIVSEAETSVSILGPLLALMNMIRNKQVCQQAKYANHAYSIEIIDI